MFQTQTAIIPAKPIITASTCSIKLVDVSANAPVVAVVLLPFAPLLELAVLVLVLVPVPVLVLVLVLMLVGVFDDACQVDVATAVVVV